MLSVLVVFAFASLAAGASVCKSAVGNVFDSSGTAFVTPCSTTATCPPPANAGATFTCDDGVVWTALSGSTTANPKWTRPLPTTCSSAVCGSNVGTISTSNLTQIAFCATASICPIQGCCASRFDLGALVKCNNGIWYGCASGAETPAYRPVCNSLCSSSTGLVGGVACAGNCPSIGCCDTASQVGTKTTCTSGAGATLTLQCSAAGPNPNFTVVPVTLQCPTASQAVTTVAYSSGFTAGGGSGTGYNSYALATGSLPTGLSINSANGLVTGTPSAAGTYTFTATVKDGAGASGTSLSCTITVAIPPTIVCPLLSTITQAMTFTSPFTVFDGAAGAKTFTNLTSLPPGLTLNTTSGLVSGTATTAGGFSYQVRVQDVAGGMATSATCTLLVNARPALTCPSNLNAATSYAYSGTFQMAGGTLPSSCAVNGTLPAGLALTSASTCTVSGTVTATASAQMCLILTDSLNQTTNRCCNLNIVPPPQPNCFAPAVADANSLYNGVATGVQLTITGGSGTGRVWANPTGLPAGMTLSSTGTLSGTPTVAGTYNVCFTVADSITTPTQSPQRCCPLTVAATSPSISCPASLVAGVGVSSSFAYSASGGTPPYTFSLSSGTLPPGMSLGSSTGVLSGSPTTANTYSPVVRVRDAANVPASVTCTFTITGQPSLACPLSNLLNLDVNSPSSTLTYAQSGGVAPYTCVVQGGTTLPAGMTASGCSISGTPTTTTNGANMCLTVTDTRGATSSRCCTLVVRAAPVPNCPGRTVANQGQAYVGANNNPQLTVTGGHGPFTWSATSLPAGLSVSSGGILSGTPTATGTFNPCFTVVDTGVTPPVTSAPTCCSFTVNPALALSCPTGLSGAATVAASWTWTATGGTPAYTYSLASGTLPAGMSLNANGTLSGTPTAGYSNSITVRVQDTAGVAVTTGACSINISAPPALSCPGSLVTAGTSTWTGTFAASGGTGTLTCSWNGTAPSGLSLNSATCVVTGTVASNTSMCIKVTDTAGASTVRCCQLQVVTGPSLQCPTNFAGTVGSPLGNGGAGIQLPSTGGSGTKVFTKINGTATISSTGLVTWTPSAAGIFELCYTYSDASISPATISRCCNITVAANAPALTCAGPFSGKVGVAASFSWPVTVNTGVPGPLVYSVTSGTVPPGMTLGTSGTISGTPTTAQASSQLCIRATDAAFTSSSPVCCNITIIAGPSFTCPAGNYTVEIAQTFSFTMTPTGGTPSYTCSIASWTPTAPLTGPGNFLTVTQNGGSCTFSGTTPTPTGAGSGSYGFCVNISDSNGSGGIATIQRCCTLFVRQAAVPGCPTQTTAAVGVAYSGRLSVAGGSGVSPTYALVSNNFSAATPVTYSLPGGFPTVSFTPAAGEAGNKGFCFSYTDSWLALSPPIQKCCPITVAASGPQVLCPATLPNMDVGYQTFVTYTVNQTGSGTLVYAIDPSNSLTTATLSSSSPPTVRVTPSVAGVASLCLKVTDAALSSSVTCCNVNVNPALQITCPSASQPYRVNTGSAWTGTWVASGGTNSYTYSNTTALLGGMTLNAATGVASTTNLTQGPGTPQVCVRVTDTAQNTATLVFNTAQVCCNFSVAAPPVLFCPTVTATTLGAVYNSVVTRQGGQAPFTWTSSLSTLTSFTFNQASLAVVSPGVLDLAGSYTLSFQVTDGAGVASPTINCPLTINAPPALTCTNLAGFVNVPLSQTLAAATGGSAPLTLTVTGLPTGLSFNVATRVISGTVTSVVSGTYTYRVTDAANVQSSQQCTYSIAPTPLLACPLSRIMDRTFAYSGTLVASGGTPPYVITLTAGSVAGLTLNGTTGVYSGTPTTVGTPSVTFQVMDANAATFQVTCMFTVTAPPSIGCPVFPANVPVALPFPQTSLINLGPGSGSPVYALSATAPPGLFVTAAGVVQGTPNTAGTYSFSASVTDSAGNTVTATGCSITVIPGPTIACPTILSATVSQAYSQPIPFTVASGATLNSITLKTGGLPSGLTLNSATQTLSGTPSSSGQSTFSLAILDSKGSTASSANCTITVQVAGCLSGLPGACLTASTVTDSSCSLCAQCCRTPNPCFAKQCQLTTVLILDNSNSMTDDLVPGVRTAVKAFLQGLLNIVTVGGSAQLGVVAFDTNATVAFPLGAVTSTYVNTLNNWVSNTYLTIQTRGNTNWADALKLGAETTWGTSIDIFILYTDGKPESVAFDKVFSPGCADNCMSASNAFFSDLCSPAGTCVGQPTTGLKFPSTLNFQPQGLWAACPQADTIKKSGSKIFLVGVGDVLPNEDEIQVITGVRAWNGQPSTFFTSDYIISQSYNELYALFAAVIQGLCPCLSSSPACSGVGQSCNAVLFSARVVITTRQSSSTTLPQYSVTYARMHYSSTNGVSAAVAYEFFPAGTPLTASSITPVRTDIINPCQLQRQVACNSACYLVKNDVPLPRFFYESTDTLGVTGAVNRLPIPGCTGFTKTAVLGVSQAIRYIWVLTSDLVTPCAAEDGEGTFYQFYQQDGATPGVYNLGLTSTFNFKPDPPVGGCSAIKCGQAVDMVFVVDEQATITTADLTAIKQFINGVIDLQANGATPPARFQVAWVCTPNFTSVPPNPIALQGTTAVTGYVQTNQVNAHSQQFCLPDFASAITSVLNTVFPVASPNPRKLITIVGGPDAGTDPNRFTNLQALLTSRNVEAWAYGVNQGSSDSVLLQNLATQGGSYAHFISIPSAVQFPNYATTQGLLSCPPANLCGASCLGFCSCINTCVCTSGGCTQDLCSLTRTCDPITKGCSGAAVNCDTGDLCRPYGCDPATGCTSAAKVCNDANNCTSDSCDSATGQCFYTPVNCNDNNGCTTDVCPPNYNPPTTTCEHLPYSGPGVCTPGNVCPNNNVCDDLNQCTDDTCDSFNNCIYTVLPLPAAPSLCSLGTCNPLTGATTFANKVCNDGNACTKDTCNPTTGNCVYTPLIYETDVWLPSNPPPATFCRCQIWSCVAPAGTWTSRPEVCTTADSCLTTSCDCTLGCVTANKTCPTRTWVAYGACEYPTGCIGTDAQPLCLYQNISSLFDFCGQCNGDNIACFFSSVFPVSSAAAISGGVAAGIAVACIVAAAIAIWLSKKGYDFYRAQSDLGSAGMTVNPTFQENNMGGEMFGL